MMSIHGSNGNFRMLNLEYGISIVEEVKDDNNVCAACAGGTCVRCLECSLLVVIASNAF